MFWVASAAAAVKAAQADKGATARKTPRMALVGAAGPAGGAETALRAGCATKTDSQSPGHLATAVDMAGKVERAAISRPIPEPAVTPSLAVLAEREVAEVVSAVSRVAAGAPAERGVIN